MPAICPLIGFLFAAQCPLWVNSRHGGFDLQCPLYPRKRTFDHAIRMSALGQKQTFAQPTLRADLPLLKVRESRDSLGFDWALSFAGFGGRLENISGG